MDFLRLPESFAPSDLFTVPGFFMLLGLSIFLQSLYRFVRSLYIYDLLFYFNIYRQTQRLYDYAHTKDYTTPCALITNAGNELAKDFTEKLAGLGFDLLLLDDAPSKTAQLQRELCTKFPFRRIQALHICPAACRDFGNERMMSYIQEVVEDFTLKVFINIVDPRPTMEDADLAAMPKGHSEQAFDDVIAACVAFPTFMIKSVLPRLQACAPSLVLNVEAQEDPETQTDTMDAACKAYLRTLTVHLAREMKAGGKEVEVLDLKVGPMARMGETVQGAMGRSFLRPSVDKFVRSALARVGCGETLLAPYWPHAFMAWWPKLLPGPVMEWLRVKMLQGRIQRNTRTG